MYFDIIYSYQIISETSQRTSSKWSEVASFFQIIANAHRFLEIENKMNENELRLNAKH